MTSFLFSEKERLELNRAGKYSPLILLWFLDASQDYQTAPLQEFNYGEEFVLLLSVTDNAVGELAEDALAALQGLAADSPSLIVQMTQG